MDNINIQYINGMAVQIVADRIWAIDEYGVAQCYLIEGTEKAALIDTGYGQGNLRSVVETLTHKPVIILNTHGHFDHIGGNDEFADHDIFLSHKDSCIVNLNENTEEENKRAFDKNFREPGFYGQNYYDLKRTYKAFPYHDLKEGDRFDLGDRCLEVYETPGHTAGCVVFLDEADRILFSGDTVVSTPILIFGGPGTNSTSVKNFMYSTEKLVEMRDKIDLIFPGHYLRPIGTNYIGWLHELAARVCNGTTPCEPVDLSHMTKENTVISRYKGASIIYTEEYIDRPL